MFIKNNKHNFAVVVVGQSKARFTLGVRAKKI
jgi:hypothetical protein